MEKYIHLFSTQAEFETAYNGSEYKEPWLSYTEENNTPAYNNPDYVDYTKIPFTIEALGSGDITWKLNSKTVQYSKNGGSWETMDSATTISVVESDEVQFKGTNANYSGNIISSTVEFNVKGNIMSLTNADDFETANSVNASGFRALFSGCTYLVSASDLKLPATTLADYCYSNMFKRCTGLITAPELPATTLADYCYSSMFYGCTSLTTAPELPATTLADYCYSSMFYGCTSLTTAPELPATTLVTYCYNAMFQGCTSLTTAPALPATTLANYCYYSMFQGCTSLTTAPELPATTLVRSCYEYMFYNCTSLTVAPELHATTLASNSYSNMFQGCTGLITAPELPATTLASACYSSMFFGCTRLTTAPELPATTLVSSCYAYMFYGCTNLNYIKAMFTTLSPTNATTNWVNGVSSSGTFVKNASATWTTTGVNGVPTGWTVQTATS